MASNDPISLKKGSNQSGSHLEPLTHTTALTKVEEHYFFSRGTLDEEALLHKIKQLNTSLPDNITDYNNVTDLAK